MAEQKTKPTTKSVKAFIDGISDEDRRKDCRAVLRLMKSVTGKQPKMWGPSIVGFGSYHYKYASGHEGDCPLVGFSPRKQNLTLYMMSGFSKQAALLEKLGKYKGGKSCLYIRRLDDVDPEVLRQLIRESVKQVSRKNS